MLLKAYIKSYLKFLLETFNMLHFQVSLLRTYKQNFRILTTIILIATLGCLMVGCGPKYQLTPLAPADPPVTGEKGMVVAAHPLAAEAGVKVLQEGGNAVDAALAALFMLNVVEPHASGLGGGGFALVRIADEDTKVIIYREKAPKSIEPAFYYDPADTTHERMKHGGSAVCVPGAAAGWAEMLDKWATLPVERLAHDAIQAAENGFPVDPTLSMQIKSHYEMLVGDSLLSSIFLNEGLPFEVGDTIRQPDLARTLKRLVEKGLRSFYRGPLAEAIVEASKSNGGFMTTQDLEFYRVETVEPVTVSFEGALSGYEAITVPPPSRGGIGLLEALNLFDITGVFTQPAHSVEAIHLMSQCLQQAYADARSTVGDPKFTQKNWLELSTVEFAIEAVTGISLDTKAGPRQPTRSPDTNEPGNTTHLVVVDQHGNAVSLTQTINHFFGAGVIAPGTGLLLNNQMEDFSLPAPDSLNLPPSPNLLEGGKRPRSNMAPFMMLKNDKPILVVGTPGGSRIIAAMAQIVTNVIVYDMDISAAIDYPRFFAIQEHLVLENRFDKKTLKKLKKKGYELHLAGPYHVYFGGAHGIVINSSGLLMGAADKRRGGAARGY